MKKRILIPLILPAILILLLTTAYLFRDHLKKLPLFTIKEITFSKTVHYTPEALLKQVSPDSGQSIFDIDLEEIKFQLKKHHWIKEVSISRIFPDKISVKIVEHRIRGVVLLDQFYYYNNDFQIFMVATGKYLEQYPLFTGLTQDLYLTKFKQFKKHIQEMEKIVTIARSNQINYPVNEVRHTLFRGYEAVLNNHYRIVLGAQNYGNSFKRARQIISLMKQKQKKIALILFNEFKNPDKVVVKLKKEQL